MVIDLAEMLLPKLWVVLKLVPDYSKGHHIWICFYSVN